MGKDWNWWIMVIFLVTVVFGFLVIFVFVFTFFFNKDQGMLFKLGIILGGGGPFWFLAIFREHVKEVLKKQLEEPKVTKTEYVTDDLLAYFARRKETLGHANNFPEKNAMYPEEDTMRDCLKFLLSFLKKCNDSAKYEISIFANPEKPDIKCHIDSKGDTTPGSQRNRKNDELYYKKQEYKVVNFLNNPEDHIIIEDFRKKTNRKNTREENDRIKRQNKRIKQQLFYCFDMLDIHVLVVSCSKKKVLKEDPEWSKIITTVGFVLNSEQLLKEKYSCVNYRKCESVEK